LLLVEDEGSDCGPEEKSPEVGRSRKKTKNKAYEGDLGKDAEYGQTKKMSDIGRGMDRKSASRRDRGAVRKHT